MANHFNKKLVRSCAYCVHGKASEYTNEIFCMKRGVTTENDSCGSYKYDPLKRVPRKTKPAGNFKPEDFEL